MNLEAYIDSTKKWISSVVIALKLCPFAGKVFNENGIRYVVSSADSPETLADDLMGELGKMLETNSVELETTVVIHPFVLTDFFDYLEFTEIFQEIMESQQVDETIQIASFHPDYQFAGTEPEDVENYTNRSPFPMLHLLREESVTSALKEYSASEEIPDRNIATMNRLGIHEVKELRNACFKN